MIVVGLRGVGKTVLLSAFRDIAEDEGDLVAVEAEITKHEDFGHRMGSLLRRALFSVAPSARWKDRGRRAAAVLRSFQITVTPAGEISAGIGGVDPAEGAADSGNLADDLIDVFVALGQAAQEHGKGVVFILDEVQFLSLREFEALIAALHKSVQRRLPITLVAAGLPQLPELAGEAKSYAERLFRFPTVGGLPEEEARKALVEPARDLDVSYEPDAVEAGRCVHRGLPVLPPGVRVDRLESRGGVAHHGGRCCGRTRSRRGQARRELLPSPCGSHNRRRAEVPAGDGRARARTAARRGRGRGAGTQVTLTWSDTGRDSSTRACCGRRRTGTPRLPSPSSTAT